MEVFVFPLVNVTLFPATTKPLNIFEPRYIKMIKDAVAQNKPVALAFIENPLEMNETKPGEALKFVRPVCGYGQVQIVEERDNGTLLVFLYGLGKIKLGVLKASAEPYLVCEAEILSETNELLEADKKTLTILHQMLMAWIGRHITDPMQRDVFTRSIAKPEEVVGAFASYLVRDQDMQQEVLQLSSLSEKIRVLYRLAGSAELSL
ncbi:MAG: LON peptidase substrate-binding domain-containing protein [Bdellovibrionia bacterium]